MEILLSGDGIMGIITHVILVGYAQELNVRIDGLVDELGIG